MHRHARPLLPLALLAALAAAPAGAQSPESPGQLEDTHLVQVTLLVASRSGPDELADLPVNTRKAVEDVRAFLPYKSYRMLDSALVRTRREGRTSLRGPDGQELEVFFFFAPPVAPDRFFVRQFELHQRPSNQPRLIPRGKDGGFEPVAPLAPPAPKRLIGTSFEASVGETVVVGSSRINGGDEALVALFTALP